MEDNIMNMASGIRRIAATVNSKNQLQINNKII